MAQKTPQKQNKKTATEENILEILEKIRPYIKMHGGDFNFISVKDGVVSMTISGACAHCEMADLTYNTLIAGLLRDEVSGIKEVVINK